MQVEVSPYFDPSNFSALHQVPSVGSIDPVSIADVLRNAFVCPPHAIFRDMVVTSAGFLRGDDGVDDFRYPFVRRDVDPPGLKDGTGDLVTTYHGLLRDAIRSTSSQMKRPWLLQSGGKDSTSLAIALAEERPETTCLTYLGGREENEIASASQVCNRLGLRHAVLTCDPARAYDRYLLLVPRIPLLTADFALLAYADIATHAVVHGADGLIDGLGSDCYFGMPTPLTKRILLKLARRWRWPLSLQPFMAPSFPLSYLLGTMQMGEERHFPGSRFSDAECDALLGQSVAQKSRARLDAFRRALHEADGLDQKREIFTMAAEAAAAFAKGMYIAHAASLQISYPYCDLRLREWVCHSVPAQKRTQGDQNKVLVREHIATRFETLPFVSSRKGSFRFDLVGLAKSRFEIVLSFAEEGRPLVPGAASWLKRNRRHLGNKFHASRFYLLAVMLPWLLWHTEPVASPSAAPVLRRA